MAEKQNEYTNYIDKKTRRIAADMKDDTNKVIKEMLMDKSSFQSFSVGLAELLVEHGYSGKTDDFIDMADFLYEKAAAAGINMKRFASKETIRNWLKDKSTPFGERSRFNMIAIAFALQMDLEETEVFFGRIFMGQPFNFRVPEECIYYYCINNHLSYYDAERLNTAYIEQYHKMQCVKKRSTIVIREQISKIRNDESMLNYLLNGSIDSQTFYNTARDLVKRLTVYAISCTNKLNEEWMICTKENSSGLIAEKITNINSLVKFIYGFPTDLCHDKKSKRKFNSDLSDVIKRNFPKQHEIGKILKDSSDINDEMVRKALIMLYFVVSYGKAYLNKESLEYFTAEQFITSCSYHLLECGFQEMYIRNAYDFIFYYCAYCAEYNKGEVISRFRAAFEAFHSVINEIYELKEEDDIDE